MGFRVNAPNRRVEPSINRTLRLKESMINRIQNLADEKNISFNSLVS